MGASCTTMKIVKVIRPVRHSTAPGKRSVYNDSLAGEESTQPESLNSEEKRNGGSDKKASSKSRKESNDTSLHVATTTNVNSRKKPRIYHRRSGRYIKADNPEWIYRRELEQYIEYVRRFNSEKVRPL